MAGTIEILAEGRHLRLVRAGSYEYCERKGITGIVAIVAVTAEDEIVLVEQERPPVGGRVLEIPAGLAGDGGPETLETAARRELLEETGYEAALWERLGEAPPSPGMTSEVLTFFRATGLSRAGAGGGDADEDIVVHLVPLAEIDLWLEAQRAAGLQVDLKLYAGLWFARSDDA